MGRIFLRIAVLALAVSSAGSVAVAQRAGGAAALPPVVVHKDPSCGCCSLWGKHMEQAGFRVTYNDTSDLAAIRTKYRVPRTLGSCHTAIVAGYVVEGHVPAADVKRLLSTKPKVVGISVPGMPLGSPGMEQGNVRQSYAVMSFDATGKTAIFAEH
jgi:hypothetical protein